MQRRQVLRAGVALSLPAVAGCNRTPDTPSATATPAAPTRRWRRAVETPPADSPMLVDGTVVFVTQKPGPTPRPGRGAYAALLGYRGGDGAPLWSFEADESETLNWQYRDTVLTSGNGTVALAPDGTDRWRRVYRSVDALFGHGNAYVGIDDDIDGVIGPGVRALDATTGTIRWHVPGEWDLSPVAVGDDAVYLRGTAEAADVRFGLHAVSPTDGSILWTTAVGPRQNDPVLLADDTLVVGGNPKPTVRQGSTNYAERPTVEGVAADDGTVQWRFTPEPDVALPRRAADGAVLVKSWTYAEPNGPPDRDSSTLYALDLADGSERWRVDGATTRDPYGDHPYESRSVATEVVGDGAAYVRLADGTVTARDLADGRERWRFDPREASWESPEASRESDAAVADHQPDLEFDGGDLLVTYADRLAALDPETGARRWEYAAGEPLTRFWTVADDAVVLTTETSVQVVERV